MDYFKTGKHQLIEENVVYTAMTLYKLIDKELYIDELFEKYVSINDIKLSFGIEKILLLALTFLFAIEKIKVRKGKIGRC